MQIRYLSLILICLQLSVSSFGQFLSPFKENGKWGYKDNLNKIIIEPKYDEVRNFYDGYAIVKLYGKYGFIDKKGKEIGEIKYELVDDFTSNVAVAQLNGKYGIVSSKGKEITDFIYDKILSFFGDNSNAPAKKNGKWGVINSKGKVLLDFNYENAGYANEGYFPVLKNGYMGYVDSKGKTLIPFEYSETFEFRDGLAEVWKDTLVGMINKKNEIIVPINYDEVELLYKSNYIAVYQNGIMGLYNIYGKQLTNLNYTGYGEELKDFLFVMKGEKMGLIDSTGNEVLACEYDRIDWDGGKAYVLTKNENYGLFSPTLKKLVIEPIYRYIEVSEDSEYYLVNGFDELYGLVNSKGEQIVPAKYYEISFDMKKKQIHATRPEGEDIYNLDGTMFTK